MKANFKELLGTELPVIQAPMAGVQDSALAIAVTNAGGLGMLPCAMLDLKQCEQQIGQLAAAARGPYGINFFAHQASDPDPQQAEVWREQFKGDYREYGIELPAIPTTASRLPFNASMAALVERFRPSVVSFHFGLPDAELLRRVRQSGARVFSSATTLEEAIWLDRHGVDAIIAQGYEAGGHRGMFLTDDLDTQMGTLALVSRIVKAVTVPVIAAGGIADAKCVRAVLDLGAVAAQVGTSYLLCPEATTSALHRHALASGHDRSTVITNVFTGRPARGFVNRLIRDHGPISPLAPAFPHATFASAALRSKAESMGRDDFTPMWAGQNPSGCKPVPAGDMTRALAGFQPR